MPVAVEVDPDAAEDLVEGGRALVLAAGLPGGVLGGEDPRRQLVGVVGVVDLGVVQPLLAQVDRVPGRQGAAPVEDDRVDRAATAGAAAHDRTAASTW